MPSINSLGVGSGLELGNLVDNLVAIERQSAVGPLDRRQGRTELKLSAVGSLQASVEGLISAVAALEGLEVGRSVDSSFPELVSGSASAAADVGSYLINVTQVAIAESLATDNANPFADADASLGEGTLTVSVNGQSLDIELAEGQDSLRSVRDAINASDLGIQAALVQEGSQYHLLLTSGQTGTVGQMTLTVTGTVDTRLASANMDITTAAQDAAYSVNGLGLTSSTNTITDVLPGVTFELHGQTGGESVVLTVGTDTDSLEDKLLAVVKAYNALRTNMSALGGASSDGSQAGPLVGDASLRALQRDLGAVFSRTFNSDLAGNPFTNLLAIGVHTDLSGTASIESGELAAAIASNEAGVAALIDAFATSISEKLDGFGGSDGILKPRTDQLSAELKRIGDQRIEIERRLGDFAARTRAKFAALDSLVAQFNSTSTYLTQQLASLAAITNYRKNS